MSDSYSKAVDAYKKGDSKKAIKYFKKTISILDKMGKLKLKGEILQNLAFSYVLDGQLEEGIKAMKESVLIFDKLKLSTKVVEGLAYIGALNYKKKNNKLALKYYKEAERIIKEKRLYNQCKEIEADICADLGSVYDDENNFIVALENFNRAIKLYRKSNNEKGIARTYLDIGLLNFHQENYEAAKSSIIKALKGLKRFNDIDNIADCHLILGKIYREQKNWGSSLNECEKALKFYELRENKLGIAESTLGIGIAKGSITGQEREGVKILQQSLTLIKKLKDTFLEGLCLAWIAKVKKKLGDSDSVKYKNMAIKKLSIIGKEGMLAKIK
ncbi:MAG: tetratricopeptide repeat protein [Candidatus Helarchaeota archaeon]